MLADLIRKAMIHWTKLEMGYSVVNCALAPESIHEKYVFKLIAK
jgi:hypothetical protein